MTYLHFQSDISDEDLRARLEQAGKDLRLAKININELRHKMDKFSVEYQHMYEYKDLLNKLREQIIYSSRLEYEIDRINQELDYREDPADFLADAVQRGGKVTYFVENSVHDTEEAALVHAKFMHIMNGVNRDFGADGDYIGDLLPVEHLVQIYIEMPVEMPTDDDQD